MNLQLRYTYIGFALTAATIIVVVVVFAVPALRVVAEIEFILLVFARIVLSQLRSRDWRRQVVVLKAANGGALPIPNPARTRRLMTTMVTSIGGLGLIALVAAAFVGEPQQLLLLILGASFLLAAVVAALSGWRLFRQRAAADRAALALSPEPVGR
ncbi:MAG: hypothetical protein ABJB03_05500 [Rhodoglobus sp.]